MPRRRMYVVFCLWLVLHTITIPQTARAHDEDNICVDNPKVCAGLGLALLIGGGFSAGTIAADTLIKEEIPVQGEIVAALTLGGTNVLLGGLVSVLGQFAEDKRDRVLWGMLGGATVLSGVFALTTGLVAHFRSASIRENRAIPTPAVVFGSGSVHGSLTWTF